MGRILEIIQSEKFGIIRGQVEEYSEDIMAGYLKECKERCENISLSPSHTKNFYDSVWGTIEINEGEIFILDCPILQRLRQIKQLGLADLLYSSANHTRYSHTLGVLQTADVMSKQITEELKKKQVIELPETRQIVRLAAIFHDCGHMFCSHASERYFQKNRKASLYNSIDNIRSQFKHLGIKPSLSEIIAILVVDSKAIRSLLEIIQNGLEEFRFDKKSQDEIIEKICCMILGFPYSEKTIPYAQVISGQIDADKLDYLKRDSHTTGVPVAVDMSRIFQKLRVIESTKSYQMIAQHEKVNNIYKIAIAPAAINTIDQLVISRAMMFENIYYHQKTLTAEDMLRYAMQLIDSSTKGILDDLHKVLCLTDCMIINNNAAYSIKCGIEDFIITNQEKFEEACNILRNLNKRQLFKRCVAFTDRNLTKVIQKKDNKEFYSRIIAKDIDEEQEQFVNSVTEQVKEIKTYLQNSKFNYSKKTDIRLLIAPGISGSALNSNIAISTKSNKDRNMEFEADNWLQSRTSRKSQNYLVSYSEDRYIVYIATEMVLLKEYGILINDAVIYSEDDEKHINELKNYLDSKGCFRDLCMLTSDDVVESYIGRMNELVEKWKNYEIFDCYTGTGLKVDLPYLKTHIKQYLPYRGGNNDFAVFVKGYLDMLLKVRILSKETIAKSLNSNMKSILTKEQCSKSELEICNIGTWQDGSAILTYHMNIVNQCMGANWRVSSLEKVLDRAKEGQRIVFLEDAFCSGKQILSIFETYMGVPLEERQTKEEHVQELSTEKKDKLKKCKLFFSFVFYEKSNEEFFYSRLREIGLQNVSIVARESFPIGYFKECGADDTEQYVVKQYMEKVAEKLIAYKAHDEAGNRKSGWTDKRMEESLLGYNDAQQLIVFSWNTPTYTMTPLWLGVDNEDFKWVPLFPRINK